MLPGRTTKARVAVAVGVAGLVLAGCSSSPTKSPNTGANTDQGQVAIRNAAIVLGPAGSSTATFAVTFVNSGSAADELTGVEVSDPKPSATYITDGTIALPSNTPVAVGHNREQHINLYGFSPTASQIVPVVFVFRDHGRSTLNVKVVPANGQFSGIVPVPLSPPAS